MTTTIQDKLFIGHMHPQQISRMISFYSNNPRFLFVSQCTYTIIFYDKISQISILIDKFTGQTQFTRNTPFIPLRNKLLENSLPLNSNGNYKHMTFSHGHIPVHSINLSTGKLHNVSTTHSKL